MDVAGEDVFLKRVVYPGGLVRTVQFYGPIKWTGSAGSAGSAGVRGWPGYNGSAGFISEYYANLLEARFFARGHVQGIAVDVERLGVVTNGLAFYTPPFGTVVTRRQSWERATAREFFMHFARAPFRDRAFRTFGRACRRRWRKRALLILFLCAASHGGRRWKWVWERGIVEGVLGYM